MYHYCMLLSGNVLNRDHIRIFEQLRKLKIKAEYIINDKNQCHIRIPDNELGKLPFDEFGPYLPKTPIAGFSIFSDPFNEIEEGWRNI